MNCVQFVNHCNCYKCSFRKVNDDYQIELIENEGILNKIKDIKEIIHDFKHKLQNQTIKKAIEIETSFLNKEYDISKKRLYNNNLECLLDYFLDLKNIYESKLFCETLL